MSSRFGLPVLIAAACIVALAASAGRQTSSAKAAAAQPTPFQQLVGSMHEHSGYSDGWPGSTPATYYAAANAAGLDFMVSSEHSEDLDTPNVFNEECLTPGIAACANADPEHPDWALHKWDSIATYAQAATDDRFTAARGFEWSSDRFGHLNVYFSRNRTSVWTDGGDVALQSFWSWFTTPASLGGGSDGLGTFNHPGAKKLSESDPAFNWSDFEYVPTADDRMVGIEVFNDHRDYGSAGGPYPEGSYAHALDKGWHVGAIGAEDLGHKRTDDWAGPSWPKTVLLATGRMQVDLKAALLARRFYATRQRGLELAYTVDGREMGSRVSPTIGHH